MLKSLILACLILAGVQVSAQIKSSSFFGLEEKPALAYTAIRGHLMLVDSSKLTQNIVHLAVGVGYASNGQITTGTGPMLLHTKFSTTTQRWSTQYGVGVMIWAAGSAVPNLKTPGIMAGPAVTALNGWVTLAGAYDFRNKVPVLLLNVSYSFLN